MTAATIEAGPAVDTVVRHQRRPVHRRGVATFVALVGLPLLAPAVAAQFIGLPAPAVPRLTNDAARVGPGTARAALDADTTGICARTSQVRDAVLAQIDGITDCADVTKSLLRGITGELDLSSSEIDSLSAGDFAGMSSVRTLNLYDADLTTLPSGLLSGMSNLRVLYLDNNALTALPADLLVPVRKLLELWATNNALTELPDRFFAGLPSLGFGGLQLYNNRGDPALRHLNVCWSKTYCAKGAPIPIAFSVQALGEGRFKVVVPIGTPFELKVALDVTNGTVAGDTITIPIGRVESDAFTLTRATDATAAVTVDIVDLRATDIDPRNLRTRGGQKHVLPHWHAGFVLVKADPATTAAPEVTGSTSFTVTEGETAVGTLSASDEDTAAEDLEWSLAGGADEGRFALNGGRRAELRLGEGLREPGRRRDRRNVRRHGRGQRRDGQRRGRRDGDAGEPERGAERGRRFGPDGHRGRRHGDPERLRLGSGRGRHAELRVESDGGNERDAGIGLVGGGDVQRALGPGGCA